MVGLLEQRPLGEGERVHELRLQLLQAERRARSGVDGHGHHRALAHDNDVLRVGVLHQLILPLLGHARHAEDAQELVHVQLVAAHRLDRDGARVQRRAELDQPVAHRRCRLHVAERQPPLGQHAKPVDVHGHRGAGAQVGELLPPLLDPVPLGRRSCLENLLKLRADATLLAELSKTMLTRVSSRPV